MDHYYLIYKYTNKINGNTYVGVTQDLVTRKARHLRGEYPGSLLYKAFLKHGYENFDFDVLKSGLSKTDAYSLEREYIEQYDTFNNGYNQTCGGEGGNGLSGEDHPHSYLTEEIVNKIINDPCGHSVAGRKYHADDNTIYNIRHNISWKYMDRTNAPEYENNQKKICDAIAQQVINDSCAVVEAAKKYNISSSNVYDIRTGKSHSYLNRSDKPKYDNANFKLTEEVVLSIIHDDCSIKDAMEKYNVSRANVTDIRGNRCWKHLSRKNAPSYKKLRNRK